MRKYILPLLGGIALSFLLLAAGYQWGNTKADPILQDATIEDEILTEEEREVLGISKKQPYSYEIYSNPLLPNQYFVKLIFEKAWKEVLYQVVEKEDGTKEITDLLEGDGGIYDDISFYSSQDGVSLPDNYLPVILAVSSSSNMGNGLTSLFVFLKDGTMEKLFEANQRLCQIGELKFVYQFDEEKDKYVQVVNKNTVLEKMDGVLSYKEYWAEEAKQ